MRARRDTKLQRIGDAQPSTSYSETNRHGEWYELGADHRLTGRPRSFARKELDAKMDTQGTCFDYFTCTSSKIPKPCGDEVSGFFTHFCCNKPPGNRNN